MPLLLYCYIIILDARINGFALLSLDESTLRQFEVSYGFKLTLMNIIENLVCDIRMESMYAAL